MKTRTIFTLKPNESFCSRNKVSFIVLYSVRNYNFESINCRCAFSFDKSADYNKNASCDSVEEVRESRYILSVACSALPCVLKMSHTQSLTSRLYCRAAR